MHLRALSPTPRQPRRLSFLRNPPQRFEMFSTTRPCNKRQSTQPAVFASTHQFKSNDRLRVTCEGRSKQQVNLFTSMSLWKSKRSIRCQLLPSKARTFQDWEPGGGRETDVKGQDFSQTSNIHTQNTHWKHRQTRTVPHTRIHTLWTQTHPWDLGTATECHHIQKGEDSGRQTGTV